MGSVFPMYVPTVASRYNVHTQHSRSCGLTIYKAVLPSHKRENDARGKEDSGEYMERL